MAISNLVSKSALVAASFLYRWSTFTSYLCKLITIHLLRSQSESEYSNEYGERGEWFTEIALGLKEVGF